MYNINYYIGNIQKENYYINNENINKIAFQHK